jgi:hypothetical protein
MRYFIHTAPDALAIVGEDGSKLELTPSKFLQASSVNSAVAGYLNRDGQPCLFARDPKHVADLMGWLVGQCIDQLQIVLLDMSDAPIKCTAPGNVLAEAYAFGDFVVDEETTISCGLAEIQDICTIPPEGWRCTRAGGHEGPCAAIPTGDGVVGD